jgi:hypothetical protein
MIVLPRNLLTAWHGADWGPDTDSRFEPHELRSNTHYARACAANGWIALLQFEGSEVIVLAAGEDVNDFRWLSLDGQSGPFVIGELSDTRDQAIVLEALRDPGRLAWEQLALAFRVGADQLLLMHAADSSTSIEEITENTWDLAGICHAIPYTIKPGIYAVDTATLATLLDGYETRYPMCRFRLLSSLEGESTYCE